MSSATGPSTRSPTASAVTWTPATATTTPAWPPSSPTPTPSSPGMPSGRGSGPSTGSTLNSASPPTALTPSAHRDVQQREAALALGLRVDIHDQRQNDPNPIVWQTGQDYRMADAIQRARAQTTRSRWGPERTRPEP